MERSQMTDGHADESRTWRSSLTRAHMLFARLVADVDRRFAGAEFATTARRILVVLRSAPKSTDAEVASILGLDRAQLSRELNKLIAKGLITHEPSLTHRRQRLLRLLEDGERVAAALEAQWTDATEAQFRRLSPREQRIVAAAAASGLDLHDFDQEFDIEFSDMQITDVSFVLSRAMDRKTHELDERPLQTARDIVTFLRKGSYATFGITARIMSKPIGCCMVLPLKENDLYGVLRYLLVDPPVRNRGIQHELIRRCIAQASGRELLGLIAYVDVRDTRLDRIYQEFGFRRDKKKVEVPTFAGSVSYYRYELRAPFPGADDGSSALSTS